MRGWLATVAVAMLSSTAAAAPHGEPIALWIDGQPKGDLVILVDDHGEPWLPADVLCAARICPAGGQRYHDTRYLALDALAGIRYRYGRDAGELRITIVRDALPETRLAMAAPPPANLEHATATSWFANYALTGTARGLDGRADDLGVNGAFESGLSIDGTLAYSSLNLLDEHHAARGLTNYTMDLPSSLVRLVAGDQVTTGGALGGGGVIGGLHVSRDFSIDPYFISQPTLTTTGVVQTTSTVEVYRDGQLIRREILPPGPYRVSDLIGTAGADTKVVIRDAFGLTQSIASTTMTPLATTLKRGLSTFDYSLGFERQLGNASFDYGVPALLAVHRYGATSWLTVGGRVEASTDRASGGPTVDVLVGRAAIEAAVAGSATAAHLSPAGMLSVAWFQRGLTLAADVRFVGARYSTLTLAPSDDRTMYAADATASWSITAHTSLLAQGSAERTRDTGDRLRGSGTASFELGRNSRLIATASASRQPGVTSVDASATFATSLGAYTTASAIGSITNAASQGASAGVAANRAMPQREGYGWQAQVTTGKIDTAFANAAVQGQHGRFEASVQWATGSRNASVSLSGGIVGVGGRVFATRAVQGGYALVRVPDTAGVRTYLDNQPVGETDARGELLIPELQAFYGNRIRVDARDLPLDVATRALERVIAPARRSGAIVELAPARAATIRGQLTGHRGDQPFDVSYGDLRLDDGPAVPVGHAGVFELESVAPGPHRGVVEVEGARCGFHLEVTAAQGLVELGIIACEVAR